MSLLIDDVSRIIGSPVSRRKMLGMVGGTVGGALLASLGLRAAAFGAPPCKAGDTACGTKCCTPSQVCMDGLCCAQGQTNCGGKCCSGTCTNGVCCKNSTFYCGGKCCASGLTCCNNVCCSYPGATCYNGKCCDSGIICNGVCCTTNQVCCDNKKCVDKHESPIKC
jgi:hypothetical protein